MRQYPPRMVGARARLDSLQQTPNGLDRLVMCDSGHQSRAEMFPISPALGSLLPKIFRGTGIFIAGEESVSEDGPCFFLRHLVRLIFPPVFSIETAHRERHMYARAYSPFDQMPRGPGMDSS